MRIFTTSFLMLIALAGCSKEAPVAPAETPTKTEVPVVADAPQAPAAPTAPATSGAPATLDSVGDEVFSVSPGSFAACNAQNGAVIGTAKWDVIAKGVSEVALYVESPGNAQKLWLNGGSKGEEKTGNWVFDKTRFILKDRLSDKEIAQVTVVAVPCP